MTETIDSANAAASTLFLGHNGEWWDFWLIASVFVVALAGAAVGVTTAGSIVSHKREARGAEQELERYKLETEKKISEANAAGDAAKARAAEAELNLAKFRTPRADILTNDVLLSIAKKLKPFAGTKFDTGLSGNSGEQADFLWRLEEALASVPQSGSEPRPNAGWIEIDWGLERLGVGAQTLRRGHRAVSGPVAAQNVELHLHPDCRDKLLPAATALVSALQDVGIAARVAAFNTHSSNDDAIHILIGDKQ